MSYKIDKIFQVFMQAQKKIIKFTIMIATLVSLSFPAYAISIRLYDELKAARDEVVLTPNEHTESMKKALAVLVGCQLDELCTMMVMKHMSTNEDNLLYIHFYNRLLKKRDNILYDNLHCQDDALNQMRKVMASCLISLNKRLTEPSDPDLQIKADNTLQACERSRLGKLAKDKNVFAQAKMMEYELGRQNTKGIEYWYEQMTLLYPTRQYHVYSQCSNKF
ncbi:hypothetical protein CC99x_003010 [Candidatus Berkiella cookevillensis]|uniref:Uncharacterized protein n=1 Tax=Candidatus Berkiella cookevillensis TaxID=437022 RepID=A0A0Q9YDC8_9GAMM|nr:hypothetical protein [Candidatus Berkiella cookevillensis]MCS5707867.1 hypothetical protein [Candidatus Berkiella cookevillensis]